MHALGLKVMLKPHVDVHDGTWRAQITPTDPGLWFESYAAFMDHYVPIAAARRTSSMLCIGTELASMSGAALRGPVVDPDRPGPRSSTTGSLTYAANGVDARPTSSRASPSGPQVDLIGVDVYTPLTDKTNPTRAELVAGWRHNKDGHDMVAAFKNWQAAYGKPFIFTEVGYRSDDGANTRALGLQRVGALDPGEQADCYDAMYEVWSRRVVLDEGRRSGGRGT